MKKENEEIKKIENEAGNVIVSENVIATVVKNSVLEIEGVKCFSGDEKEQGNLMDILNKIPVKEKGVKVNIKGKDELMLEVYVVLKFGTNVIEVAKVIQERAKEAVESLVGMHVIDVDVYVDEIAVD